MHTYKYPKAANTVDAVVFTVDPDEGSLQILLIRRGREGEPFFDHWALPGGFIEIDETLEESLHRELREETGLRLSYVEQLHTFGDPGRDPRGRVISTAFIALVSPVEVHGGDDAAEAKWFDIRNLPSLAFDHAKIIHRGLHRLRARILNTPLAACLLPQEFTLRELQQVYDIVLGSPQNRINFRKRILFSGCLEETGNLRRGSHRPATLYTFKEEVEVEGALHVTRY